MVIDLNGNKVEFEKGVTVDAIAESLGESVKKSTLCARVDGELVDLSRVINKACTIELLTFKDEDGRKVFNHTASHVLAQAVKTIFPTAKLALGPATEDGFYCDFEFKTPPTLDDLEIIESEMRNIIKANLPMSREELPRESAYSLMSSYGEFLKLELIEASPKKVFSIYRQGNFADLCSGPHLKATGLIKAFKLTGIGSAYWMDDEKNTALTRIYGVAFDKKSSLQDYLLKVEEEKNSRQKGHITLSSLFRKKISEKK